MSMSHVRALDGLRAIAVLFVFVAHCGLENRVPGGMGVTIFFFLSGYLITSLLRSEVAQTGRVDLGRFYIRRTLRIWPPLYITAAVSLLVALVVPPPFPVRVTGVLAQLAFISNYSYLLGLGEGAPWMPLWSLAVEEHFYLLFPFLFAFMFRKMPPARTAAWCAAGCALVLVIRLIAASTVAHLGDIYYWSHTRIDSILYGCCLAMWQNPALDAKAWRPRLWHVGGALAVLLLCLVVRDEWFRQTLRYSLQGLALFVLFSAAITSKGLPGKLLGSAPLRVVALYSYTLYLIHPTIIAAIEHFWPSIGIPMMIVTAGTASMLYAWAMYRFVEKPAARMRKTLHTADADATMVSAAPAR